MRTNLFLTVILFFVSINILSAQAPKFVIELKKIEIKNDLTSPIFPDQIDKTGSKAPKKWGLLTVKYNITFDQAAVKASPSVFDNGKWLDRLTLDWQFLYKPEKAPNTEAGYMRFNQQVTYSNITEGEHTALLFIDPTILQRYFDEGRGLKRELHLKLDFKANDMKQKIMIGPNPFDSAYFSEGKLVKSLTPALIQAFDNDRIKKFEGIVLPRNKTPFRDLQHDNYDTIVEENK